MATVIVQPIAGVSSSRETEVEVIYPSIAGGVIGWLIGSIMGLVAALPVLPGILKLPTLAIRLSAYVIVGGALLPLALLGYILHKLLGNYYVLTNRSIQDRSILGGAMSSQMALADIENIEISTAAGYEFHRVGDVNLQNAQGVSLMTLKAISYPERLSQIILDVRAARTCSDASFATIQARK